MHWPFIRTRELQRHYTLFAHSMSKTTWRWFFWWLTYIEKNLGWPLFFALPDQLVPYADDSESLRAHRIMAELKKAGFFTEIETVSHDHADEPLSYRTVIKVGIDRLGMWGRSVHLYSRHKTLWPAIGEAIERLSQEKPYIEKGDVITASYRQLQKPKVDIFSIGGMDDTTQKRGHPIFKLEFDEDSTFSWLKTTNLTDNETVYAPLQWFSFAHISEHLYHAPPEEREPLLNCPITTGAAAGQTDTDALFAGLCEVVERDAFMIYWLNQIPAQRVDWGSIGEPRFRKIKTLLEAYNLELHLLYLKTDVPIHTVCGVLLDRTGVGPALTMDAKTGPELSDCAYDVAMSLLAGRGVHRTIMANNQTFFTEKLPANEELVHLTRVLYWYRPEQLTQIEPFIAGPLTPITDFPTYDYTQNTKKNLDRLLTFFKTEGHQVLYKKIVPPEIAKLADDISVVVVRVPQFQPLYLEERLRSIQGDRLRTIPELLGHPVDPVDPDPFFTEPHPFP